MQLSTIKSINECISDRKFHEQIGKCEDWGRLKGSEINSLMLEIKKYSPSGSRTWVPRVTGGDTYHYTNEDYMQIEVNYSIEPHTIIGIVQIN